MKLQKNILLVASFCVAGAAMADKSECSDVLRNGTLKTEHYSQSYSIRQLIDYRFSQMEFDEAKKNKDYFSNIPIGDVVIGAGFTEAQFDQRKKEIKQSLNWDVKVTNDVDFMLSSGDPVIVSEWGKCMRDQKRGLLSIRYADVTAKSAVAIIEWFGAAGVNEVVLNDFSPPSGVTIVSGGECFSNYTGGSPSKIISGTEGCHVQLEFTSAQLPVSLTVNSIGQGGATAYLAPRLKPERLTKPLSFPGSDNLGGECVRSPVVALSIGVNGVAENVAKYCAEEGWSFEKETATYSVYYTRRPNGAKATGEKDHKFEINGARASVYYKCWIEGRNSGTCFLSPNLTQYKWEWKSI